MNKNLFTNILFILIPISILVVLTFLNFTINAGTASAADVKLDIDGAEVGGAGSGIRAVAAVTDG